MVLATIRMIIPPKKRGEAVKILRSMAERSWGKTGFLDCHLYKDVQDENVLTYEETWRSEEDLTHHLRSEEYLTILMVMEMALKLPEVSFRTVSATSGMETIEKARNFTP